MKKKKQKSHVYQGLGFPVILLDVPMVQIRGHWVPDVRLGRLQELVVMELALSRSRLQGVHVAFLRKWLELTLEEFGALFGVTHAAVIKWERRGEEATNASVAVELAIRMYVLDRVMKGSKAFRDAYRQLVETGFESQRSYRLKVAI